MRQPGPRAQPMIAENQHAVVKMLKDPAAYGEAGPIETIETHISRIFLVGRRAFKLKRAVKLPYVDFSTPGLRLAACEKEVDVALWQEWMNEDFVEAGFKLQAHEMRCCGMKYTLHELAYEWPQGFARCDIYAMNPRMGRISTARRRRFAELLGCAVRVVYEHI